MAIPALYRVSEAAQALHVSHRQVRRYMDNGLLGHVHINRRGKAGLRLVPEAALLEFLNRYAKGCRFDAGAGESEPSPPQRRKEASL